ncbi:MAG TPA: phage holin family protein [Solirubrobacteraceae bacterium]|nr:phage holin family protein [Solirubrobacteraceae bacterium]
MADTVDTAASLSPADEADKPPDAPPADEAETPQDARSDAPEDEPERPEEEAEEPEEEAEEPEDARSVTELLEQLSRELSDLVMSEARLEAARNMPEVRRSARDIAGALVVAVAALAAFAFLNVAAVDGLSHVLPSWLAALVLAAFWTAVGGVLLFGLMGRARRWLLWIVLREPPTKALDELEQERDSAIDAARRTLEQLGPAIAIQIAVAAVPKAGEVASGVVGASDSVLDATDEIVEEFTAEIPGGGAVNQVWGVVLMPGRLGIRVASTVLRRGRPADSSGGAADTSGRGRNGRAGAS